MIRTLQGSLERLLVDGKLEMYKFSPMYVMLYSGYVSRISSVPDFDIRLIVLACRLHLELKEGNKYVEDSVRRFLRVKGTVSGKQCTFRLPVRVDNFANLDSVASSLRREHVIVAYRSLFEIFIDDLIDPVSFESIFFEIFLGGTPKYDLFESLNEIFYSVEDFVAEPSIREEGDLDEHQLKEDIRAVLHADNDL
ncbi:colicin immunity domain-containing protein [Actinopolyspora erythraea]|nr:colicin immunity domain-containing protein [Actinopolyspora erythraea]